MKCILFPRCLVLRRSCDWLWSIERGRSSTVAIMSQSLRELDALVSLGLLSIPCEWAQTTLLENKSPRGEELRFLNQRPASPVTELPNWCMGAPSQIRNAGPLSQPEYLCDRNQCFQLDVTECFGCHVALLRQELMESPSLALISLLASKFLPSLRRLKYVEKQQYWVGKHRIRMGPHPICVIREYLLQLPGPPFPHLYDACVSCTYVRKCLCSQQSTAARNLRGSVILRSRGPILLTQPFCLCFTNQSDNPKQGTVKGE